MLIVGSPESIVAMFVLTLINFVGGNDHVGCVTLGGAIVCIGAMVQSGM